jgi:hypothetical protein
MRDPYIVAEEHRRRFVEALHSQIGRPYLWGGQSEEGFDCSGLIVWALNEAGLGISDMTADGLADQFHSCRVLAPGKPGELCFYGDDSGVNHVMAVLTTWGQGMPILVGARGGIDTTDTLKEAYDRGAYVCTKTARYWESKRLLVVDPFMVRC